MHRVYRHTYHMLLRLHPAEFRKEFARDMALDFEDALHTFGHCRLFLDATNSLARQWCAKIFLNSPDPISATPPSLLAGNYISVRDRPLSASELGRGLIASSAQLAVCALFLGAGTRQVPGLPTVYASSRTPGIFSNPDLMTYLPECGGSIEEVHPFHSSAASLGFTLPALPSTARQKPELLLIHPSEPLPSYEVATVRPIDANSASSMVKLPPGGFLSPLSIRRYIMDAYGAMYALQVVGGPDWLNKDSYLINGKVPDNVELSLHEMRKEDRISQIRLMKQSLLIERFHLKAHYETRILPVYELAIAKGGIKIRAITVPPELETSEARKADSNSLPPGSLRSITNSKGLPGLKGHAIKMQLFVRAIAEEIGDRPIVDRTGFTDDFDIADFTWAPPGDASAARESDAPSLSEALQEKLGLKLVPANDPIEVLVVDEIQRPTPN